VKKRRLRKIRLVSLAVSVGQFLLRSHLLTLFLALCTLGFWAGTQARPDPFHELFENLGVLSYREAPSDSTARFVVELTAGGRAFREYDLDAGQFSVPVRGRDYRRTISGTHYRPLRVRGHVEQGFWLELPDSLAPALLPYQLTELYRTTLEYVKPVSVVTSVLSTLSGYSIGYRLATWGASLSNPAVQDRMLATPGLGRMVAREAWRRVLLEPVVTADESDARRFAAVHGTHRIYTNFFKLALNDSNGFIRSEAARLDSAGQVRESRAMVAFAEAVHRAAQDTCALVSSDFDAIEDWASLLSRHGHWARGVTPSRGEERMRYFGMLAWYGLAPPTPDERRLWVGPRVLVHEGEMEGFVTDDIPLVAVACPMAWQPWLNGQGVVSSTSAWTAQYLGASREFAPVVDLGRGIVRRLRGW
jgi:hypothetical protein